jgi:hypothetical protein
MTQIYKPYDPNKEQDQQGSLILNPGGQGAGPAPMAQSNTGGGVTPTTPRGSGAWTNVQRYLDLNEPQTGQMAGQLISPLLQEGQAIKSDLTTQGQDYSGIIGAAQTKSDDEMAFWDRMKTAGYIPTAEEIAKYGGTELGQEAEITPFNPNMSTTDRMVNYARNVGQSSTEPGRMAMLEGMEGQGTTQGESLLNQMLLQGSPSARNQFASLQASPSQLGTQAVAMTDAYGQALQDLYNEQQGYVDKINPYLQNQVGGLEGQIGDWQTAYNTAVSDKTQGIQGRLWSDFSNLAEQQYQQLLPDNYLFTLSDDEILKMVDNGTLDRMAAVGIITKKDALRKFANQAAVSNVVGDIQTYLPNDYYQFTEGGAPSYTSWDDWQTQNPVWTVMSSGLREDGDSRGHPYLDLPAMLKNWTGHIENRYGSTEHTPVHQDQARLDALNALMAGEVPADYVSPTGAGTYTPEPVPDYTRDKESYLPPSPPPEEPVGWQPGDPKPGPDDPNLEAYYEWLKSQG